MRPRPLLTAALPYSLFFISGLSALIYQTAWQRTLGLFSGSDAVAASLVVGAFLFGLGLGSVGAASFADRLSHRGAIRAFAACELGIAAFALASRFLFYDLVFGRCIALSRSPALILVVVFLALLPPTALMGMSLPLLARAIVARMEMAPSSIGWLYGVNTLGAAVGTLLGGFYVIGTFGYEVAVYLGAILNLSIGASALVAASSFSDAIPEGRDVGGHQPQGMTSRVWLWSLLVFGSGFLIVSLEIVWLRVLGLLMQSDAYAFSVVLFVFLAGDALGIVYGALTIGRVADPKRFFLLAQGALATYALLSLALVGLGHTWFDLPRFFVEAPPYGTEASASEIVTRFLRHFGLAVAVVARRPSWPA
jgi:spermidine synthase